MASPAESTLDLVRERELLLALKGGDESAFESLVRIEAPRMLAVARRFSGNEEDAREAVQEAFAAAFQALPRFEGASRLSTWLHRIVVNAALAKVRQRSHRAEVAIDDLTPRFSQYGYFLESPAAWQPEARLEDDELRDVVRAAIAQLPEGYRDVLVLRDIQGLDVDVVAVQLGLTANAVRIRAHRARQALRTLLDPHFKEGAA